MPVERGLDGQTSHCSIECGKPFANLHTTSVYVDWGRGAGKQTLGTKKDMPVEEQGSLKIPKSRFSVLAETPSEPVLLSLIALPRDRWE